MERRDEQAVCDVGDQLIAAGGTGFEHKVTRKRAFIEPGSFGPQAVTSRRDTRLLSGFQVVDCSTDNALLDEAQSPPWRAFAVKRLAHGRRVERVVPEGDPGRKHLLADLAGKAAVALDVAVASKPELSQVEQRLSSGRGLEHHFIVARRNVLKHAEP